MLRSRPLVGFPHGKVLTALLVGAAIAFSLGGSVGNGFVYDDVSAIVENSRVHDPTDLGTIFSSPYWTNTLYRPVTTTAFAGLWWLGGGGPLPFHLANLAVFFGVCLLLYQVLDRIGASPAAALIASLIFAVHPVHVEVVANGVGLAELLSTGFLMAGAVLTIQRPWGRGTLLLLGACGLLSFLSKESGITALALIPLLWWVQEPTETETRTVTQRETVLVLLLFLVVGLAVRTSVLGGLSGETPIQALDGLETVARLQTVLGVIPEWVRLLMWPASLQADYGPPQIPVGPPIGWRHAAGLLVLLGWGTALVIATRRRARLIAGGLLWIPIALSPVSNVFFPTGILLAERTLFLPSVGLALIMAGLVDALPLHRKPILGLAAVLILLGGQRSHSRVGVWRDQETFARQLVIDGARGYRSWYVAAGLAAKKGERSEERLLLAEAWRLADGDYRVAEEYGQRLRASGDHEGAIGVFAEAFRKTPDREPLTSRLLESLIALERWEDAEALIHEVATRSPEDGNRLRRRLDTARAAVGFGDESPLTPPDTGAGSAIAPAGP